MQFNLLFLFVHGSGDRTLRLMGSTARFWTGAHSVYLTASHMHIHPVPGIPPEFPDLSSVPTDYKAVFSKFQAVALLPYWPYDCDIDLLPGMMPPRGHLYSLSQPETEAMEKYIQELLASGIIHPSSSPAKAWFFFMTKKDGTICLCIDYWGLNDVTIKDQYPFPFISSAFELLHGFCI